MSLAGDNTDVVRQSTLVQVLHKCREALIQERDYFATMSEVGPVPVKIGKGDGHAPRPRFDQSPCRQEF